MSAYTQPELSPQMPRSRHECEFQEFKATPIGGMICNRFIRIAWGFLIRGQKIGAKAIVERLRWNAATRKHEGERYFLNNNWTAYLARWAMQAEPRLDGFFNLREIGRPDPANPLRAVERHLHAKVAELRKELERKTA